MEAQWNTVPSEYLPTGALWHYRTIKRKWLEIVIPNALGYILELKENYLSSLRLEGVETRRSTAPGWSNLLFLPHNGWDWFFLAGLMLGSVFYWLLGKLSQEKITQQRWLMRAWMFAAPLGFIAIDTGWIVRCVATAMDTLWANSHRRFCLIFRLVMSWYRSQPSQLFTSCCWLHTSILVAALSAEVQNLTYLCWE